MRDSGPRAADEDPPLAPGLYLVGTPIGNLEDITLRALRVLRGVSRIACEDTRVTGKLLHHFGIQKSLVSLHAHNEGERAPELVAELAAGGAVAVVSDAGMPGVSDPGMLLVRHALAAGVPVVPVPGASAGITALVASGLPVERWWFGGFLPEKAGARRTELERLRAGAAERGTHVFYEAPHRVLETLADLEVTWGAGVPVTLARELTKLHEEFLRGTASSVRGELAARDKVRGEMVLLVDGTALPSDPAAGNTSVAEAVRALVAAGAEEKDAMKQVARERGLGKSEVYREMQRARR